ncbi:hypothetical protein AB4Z51_13400 [Bradyrhizobium sp. 2TAF36]|uniref:hypothetical protein n=1 Tax=Bradyrhizobium sp. 2TAF36 TaxID=3233016 RepID=UPI003F909A8A
MTTKTIVLAITLAGGVGTFAQSEAHRLHHPGELIAPCDTTLNRMPVSGSRVTMLAAVRANSSRHQSRFHRARLFNEIVPLPKNLDVAISGS